MQSCINVKDVLCSHKTLLVSVLNLTDHIYAIFIMSCKHLMAKLIFTKTGAKAFPCVKEARKLFWESFHHFLDKALHRSLLKPKVSFWCTSSTISL